MTSGLVLNRSARCWGTDATSRTLHSGTQGAATRPHPVGIRSLEETVLWTRALLQNRSNPQSAILQLGNGSARAKLAGQLTLVLIATAYLLVVLPVVLRAGPLHDDFGLCTSPRWTSGLARAASEVIPETGAVRFPGRVTQALVISTLCAVTPFWVLILVPLTLTLVAGALVFCLLVDLGVPAPWPHLGAALWLLQPLGTESALWATQFNIPFGLCMALLALFAFRRSRSVTGALFGLVGYGFVEQIIFGLPAAAWLLSPGHQRRRALAWAAGSSLAVLAVYAHWPGHSERTAMGMLERLVAPAQDLRWYVKYPAVSFGLHSIPVAFLWALPMSAVVVFAAVLAGARFGSLLFPPTPTSLNRAFTLRGLGALLTIIVLINVPLLTTLDGGRSHPSSPRTFAPTWLALVVAATIAGSRQHWKRPRLAGASTYVLMSGSLLSLALSVSVRIRTADSTEASSKWLAERVPNGGTVLICNVPRTAVTPAPAGDFAVHELIFPSGLEAAIRYYTGRTIAVRRVGTRWPGPCSREQGVDLVVSFDELPRSLGVGTRAGQPPTTP